MLKYCTLARESFADEDVLYRYNSFEWKPGIAHSFSKIVLKLRIMKPF